ncbi:MAG TPA: response regulator, partial [Pyrinomonadaceae bacterium]|nr:response regulator [Pyrinomonadaceae bacterium]
DKKHESPPADLAQPAIVAGQLKGCVLLVEDDRSARRYLEVTLQRAGYRVITAKDGLEAMKLALSSPIDALVTDNIMPHLSGQQLARFVRSNAKLASVPIVLLTGQENKAAAASPDDQIDAFLYKPVKAEKLRRCLARLLRKSQSPDQST